MLLICVLVKVLSMMTLFEAGISSMAHEIHQCLSMLFQPITALFGRAKQGNSNEVGDCFMYHGLCGDSIISNFF